MRTLVIAGEYPWPENSGSTDPVGHGPARPAALRSDRALLGGLEVPRRTSTRRTRLADLAKVGRVGFDNRPPSALALVPALLRPANAARACPGRTGARCSGPSPGSCPDATTWSGSSGPARGYWPASRSFAPTVLDLDRPRGREDPGPAVRSRLRPPAGAVGRVRRAAATRGRRGRGPAVAAAAPAKQPTDRRPWWCAASSMPSGPGPPASSQVEVIPNGYPRRRPSGRTADGGHAADRPVPGPPPVPPEHRRRPVAGRRVRPRPSGQVSGRGDPVGRGPPARAGRRCDDPPRVTVTGRVPDMAAELARADVVVVPVRYGSGTRLKILEAFAQRVPVVSTPLGAEGLGVEDGVHLLFGRHGRGAGRCLRPPAAATPRCAGVRSSTGPLALPRSLPERGHRAGGRPICARRVAGRPDRPGLIGHRGRTGGRR